jgi:hypothetical protein
MEMASRPRRRKLTADLVKKLEYQATGKLVIFTGHKEGPFNNNANTFYIDADVMFADLAVQLTPLKATANTFTVYLTNLSQGGDMRCKVDFDLGANGNAEVARIGYVLFGVA